MAAPITIPRLRWTSLFVLIPIVATFMRIADPRLAILSYLVIGGYAFMGRPQSIVSLFLCCVFNLTSHGFPAGPPQAAAFLRYFVYVCAAYSVFSRGRPKSVAPDRSFVMGSTLLVCLVIVAHSMIASQIIDVSLLKIVSFTVVIMTIFAGWAWMTPQERQAAEKVIFGGLMLIGLASLPLIGRPMGYMRNRLLFQGVLVHPNNFGPFMALLAAVLAMQLLVMRRLQWWRIGMLVMAVVLTYLSRSRMALVAMVGGIAVALMAEAFRVVLVSYRKSPRLVGWRVAFTGLATVIPLLIFFPRVSEFYKEFLKKGSAEVESFTDAFEKTRGMLIEPMWENIARRPMQGIGFGVASNPEQWVGIARDPILGLPVMFTIEKGVLPIAVIEELGYPIACLVFAWLAFLSLRATRGGILPFVAYCVVMIGNLAENTLFSPGGMGLLVMLVMGWAVTARPGNAAVEASPQRRPRPVIA